MKKVLISTFGSAGDVFPLIPVANELRATGFQVAFASPRSIGLIPRAAGFPVHLLGSGDEMRVLSDAKMLNGRFDGWDSQRRTWVDYVAPSLEQDVRALQRWIDQWRPDVIVTTSYAAAARIVAFQASLPQVDLTIYPDHLRLMNRATRFATRYQDAVISIAPGASDKQLCGLAWGISEDVVLLYEPVLGSPERLEGGVVAIGYPYWDGVNQDDAIPDSLRDWCAGGTGPVVVITFGSFLGFARPELIRLATEAVTSLGARAVVANVRGSTGPTGDTVYRTGFLPLSQLLPLAQAVIHHGGLGTTLAGVRAARPAVILPIAFDQFYVARRAVAAGVAELATASSLRVRLASVLADADGRMAASSRSTLGLLSPSGSAANVAAERIALAAF